MLLMESTQERLPEENASWLFLQLLSGLHFCHQRNIVHGDIKPENLLLNDDVLKIADFSSRINAYRTLSECSPTYLGIVGSSVYAAPELKHDLSRAATPVSESWSPASASASTSSSSSSNTTSICHPAVDIWSAGVTLFVMCAGYTPWTCASENDASFKSFLHDPESFFPPHFSPELRGLLRLILQLSPQERPSAEECMGHPWVMKAYRFSIAQLGSLFPVNVDIDSRSEALLHKSLKKARSFPSKGSGSSRTFGSVFCGGGRKLSFAATVTDKFKARRVPRRKRSSSVSVAISLPFSSSNESLTRIKRLRSSYSANLAPF